MRMRKSLSIGLATVAVACAAHTADASELNITAKYTGYESGVGQFKNTTPISGVCADNPSLCAGNYFSLRFPWSSGDSNATVVAKNIVVSRNPREGIYFGFDATRRKIQVRNQVGDVRDINLSIDGISWQGAHINNTTGDGDGSAGSGSAVDHPLGINCNPSPTAISLGYYREDLYTAIRAARAECYIPFSHVDTADDDPRALISNIGFHYSLSMNKPWAWQSGTYTGSYTIQVGAGQELDFGDNISSSTYDSVTLNFRLDVSPNMYVRFNAGPGGVVNADLQPPGGWLNWQGKMPPYLSSDVPFDFGASGPVKIHLANCDHPVGDTCGIVDFNGSGSPLGVDALLTDNRLNEDSGKQAIRSRLSTQERIFKPNTAAGGTGIYPAHLLLKTQDGVTQQMQRGHHYGGHMTVVFDSNVN